MVGAHALSHEISAYIYIYIHTHTHTLVYNPCICMVQLKTTQLHRYGFKLYLV